MPSLSGVHKPVQTQNPRLIFRQKLESLQGILNKTEYADQIDEIVRGVPTKLHAAYYLHALKSAAHGIFDRELLQSLAESLKSSMAQDNAVTILRTVWTLPREKFTHGVSIAADLMLRRSADLQIVMPLLRAGNLDALEQRLVTLDASKQPVRTRRTLASVADDFRSIERSGIEPAEKQHLARAVDLVENVQSQAVRTPLKSLDEIRTAALRLKSIPSADRTSAAFRQEFLFLADQAVRVIYKMQLYETQLLTAALMIDPAFSYLIDPDTGTELKTRSRGRYAQVRTGEGKSLVIALVSAYCGLAHGRTHVLTSNEYLAQRDASKFRGLFQVLGLSNGSFSQARQDLDAGTFAVDVLYTTSSRMVFHKLDSDLDDVPFCHGHVPKIGLFDEADNVFVDLSHVVCRKAIKTPSLFCRESLVKMLGLMEPCKDSDESVSSQQIDTARSTIPEASGLSDRLIRRWLRSAKDSFKKKKDFHYHVNEANNEIQVVDQNNTGRILKGVQWGNGIQEFVHVRELPRLPKTSGTVIELSHPRFIRQTYWRIFGFSGTFGLLSDRAELKSQYGLCGFDVPPYWPNQRTDEQLKLFPSDSTLEKALQTRLRENQLCDAASLVVVDSIDRSRRFRTSLRTEGFKPQLLNDVDNHGAEGGSMGEDDILKAAGHARMVTVATYVAGRGADIIQSQSTPFVDSILTAEPENARVEIQARGRAGRMGKPGKSALWISLEDPFFSSPKVPQVVSQVLLAAAKDDKLVTLLPPLVNFWREVSGCVEAIEREIVEAKGGHVQRVTEEGYLELCSDITQRLLPHRPFTRMEKATTREVVQAVVNGPWVRLLEDLHLDMDSAMHAQQALDIHDATFENLATNEVARAFELIFKQSFDSYVKAHGNTSLTRYTQLVVAQSKEVIQKALCHRTVCLESARIKRLADDALTQVAAMREPIFKRLRNMNRDEIMELLDNKISDSA